MNGAHLDAIAALNKAKAAYSLGKYLHASKFASVAIQNDPNLEEAWLILAALGAPQASISYLEAAQHINPNSIETRKGLIWAHKRLERIQGETLPPVILGPSHPPPIVVSPAMISKERRTKGKHAKQNGAKKHPLIWLMSFMMFTLMICAIASIWIIVPNNWVVFAENYSRERPEDVFIKPKLTSTNTSTFIPTKTMTPSPPPTSAPIPTITPVPTSTPPLIETDLPNLPPGLQKIPDQVEADEKWINVNVSNQTIYAMEGSKVVNTYRVSTGKSDTPTVNGKFYIYFKSPSAPMRGEDYYYPEIPYVMYFYQGYGFHGVTWPLKLGVPTSHGCINMITSDAEWLYNWSELGTLINVHF